MKKLDQFLAFLAYCRRIMLQFTDLRNIRYFYLVFQGFTPNKGLYYDFDKYDSKSYLKDYKRYLKHVFINYKYKDIFKDKYANYLYLGQFTDKLVPVYGIVDNGQLYLTSSFTPESIFTVGSKFVLKPRKGAGGQGVLVLDIKSDGYYLNGTQVSTEKAFDGLYDYVLVPYVFQHQYASEINPNSLNTIRLLTCIINNESRIIGAVHRFGSSTTGSVDNFTQGGISAKIDINTGVIEKACLLNKKEFKKQDISVHPDSNRPIVGLQIPFWSQITKEMLQLHKTINYIKYVGWDIAVESDGYTIVEANHVSDIDVFQVHEPLLINDLNKSFYDLYS